MNRSIRTRILSLIAIMTLLTVSRTMVTLMPKPGSYPGSATPSWACYLPLQLMRSGTRVAPLITYSFMGAFDYAHGLGVQWHYPQVTEGAVSAVIYSAISFGLIMNLGSALLLLRSDVRRYFVQ